MRKLKADTVTIRRPGATCPAAVAMFRGPAGREPGATGGRLGLPGDHQEADGQPQPGSFRYDAVFAVPLTPAPSLKAAVDLDGSNPPGMSLLTRTPRWDLAGTARYRCPSPSWASSLARRCSSTKPSGTI